MIAGTKMVVFPSILAEYSKIVLMDPNHSKTGNACHLAYRKLFEVVLQHTIYSFPCTQLVLVWHIEV